MRTTIGEIVVRVALLEQLRKPLSKRANVVRDILGPNPQELYKFHERIFDRSQDPLFKGSGRPAFRKVPAERQPIGELSLRLLVAATSPTTTVVLAPSRRYEMHIALGQVDLNG